MQSVISEQCLFVAITQQKSVGQVFDNALKAVQKDTNYNVIIDFSKVMVLFSKHLTQFLMIRSQLDKNGKRLILCNIPFQIKCELRAVGLYDVLEISEDKFSAMNALGIEVCGN